MYPFRHAWGWSWSSVVGGAGCEVDSLGSIGVLSLWPGGPGLLWSEPGPRLCLSMRHYTTLYTQNKVNLGFHGKILVKRQSDVAGGRANAYDGGREGRCEETPGRPAGEVLEPRRAGERIRDTPRSHRSAGARI